ncbi:hypothetical protein SLEP1_g59885 [Rubroshorea leprosula]|uniref:Uncharacterized protein n=1 Tax=Rubroshorea leprosula TaxID=152421 RepID=A0AAV5MXS2_9ROSI|nr:hypothetical protein SLEP1_g59885 [Rubroshorea leprosula]
MVSTHNKRVSIVLLMFLGTWAFQAVSRVLDEETIVQKHRLWMIQYGRAYVNEAEEGRRFKIFKDNLEYIENFNTLGNQTYELSLNIFADLNNEEFAASHTGYKDLPIAGTSKKSTVFRYENLTDFPPSVDWIQAGAVTNVQNQGDCNCCWAFSAVAAVEAIIQIKTGNLISLSEQQLVDCVDSNDGCSGGWMDNAFHYIVQNQGITSDANYPYKATDKKCDSKKAAVSTVTIHGYEDVPANNEAALLKAVSKQPVSVCLEGASKDFQFYSRGIFTGKCGTSLNHAVTVVGYGTSEDGTKYWLAKNSWGINWGEKGYMRILREIDAPQGLCGIAKKASYPIA